ncbi:MAG: hypothetical protein GF317_23225 [Candidatus Lokiarchaeota archaeon]|nr:hypothetical protein [Candidatus Lokiarchaeota archaeon]
MGNPIRQKAKELGFLNFTKTTLYAQPSSVRQTFSRCVPNIDKELENYISRLDKSFMKGRTGGVKAHTYSIIAPKENIYIEDTDHYVGWAHNEKNHVLKIDIYSDSNEKVSKIAKIINKSFPNGIVPNIRWNKIKKKYNINEKECIATWNHLLNDTALNPSKKEITNKLKMCQKCGRENPIKNNYCEGCGKKFE